MTVYLLYVISPIIVAGLVKIFINKPLSEEKNKNYCIAINGIIMILMIGLRHYSNGSSDSRFYYDTWANISKMDFSTFVKYMKDTDLEKGFLLSNFFLTRVFKDPQFAFILSGFFFAVSTSMFVKKNCKDSVLPFIIFNSLGLFNFMVQGMRQAIAMCICLYAYEFAKKKKIVGFALMVLLAMSFHASALVFVIVFAIRFLKFNTSSLLTFAVGGVLGTILLPQIFELLNKIMNDAYGISDTMRGSSRIITFAIHLSIILFGLFLYGYRDKKNDYSTFIYMAVIASLMFLLSSSVNPITERISYYFMFAQMVVVSNALYNVKDKRYRVVFAILIVSLFFMLAIHKTSYSSLIPYKFMWS